MDLRGHRVARAQERLPAAMFETGDFSLGPVGPPRGRSRIDHTPPCERSSSAGIAWDAEKRMKCFPLIKSGRVFDDDLVDAIESIRRFRVFGWNAQTAAIT